MTYYASPHDPGETGFPDIPGANRSAYLVANRLLRAGATFGILLTSARGHFVGLTDIYSALARTEAELAKRPASAHPILVFYFAGHGISEGVAWSHFSVPGNLVFRQDGSPLSLDGLATSALYASSLAQRFDELHIPYLILLDTCYYGRRVDFHSPVLSQMATQNLEGVAAGLRFLNQFHQTSPVVFASAPGSVVTTVPDPTAPQSDAIAPIARRLVLAFDRNLAGGHRVTLADLVGALGSATLDTETKPAVSYAVPAADWANEMGVSGTRGVLKEVRGATRDRVVCCTDSTAPPDIKMGGALVLQSRPGEPLMGQRRKVHMALSASADLIQRAAGAVEISFVDRGANWEVDLSVPGTSGLKPGHYANVQEYGLADSQHDGLFVSGAGTACDEIRGDFDIRNVAYDSKGHLALLVATLRQFCDGSRVPLVGTVDLHSIR